jgi:hypothetical protein
MELKEVILMLINIDSWIAWKNCTLLVNAFCPSCHDENFFVLVDDGGSGPDEWGTFHWFSGNGACLSCGHEQGYCDSSH